jgi:hypothetical protein
LGWFSCNTQACSWVRCDPTKELDIVLLIDGGNSMGQTGWDASKEAAHHIVSSLGGGLVKIAIIVFSGPSIPLQVDCCTGERTLGCPANMNTTDGFESTCRLNRVANAGFNNTEAQVITAIDNMQYPNGGSTLTSLGLIRAATELQHGRSTASSVVVVITDGRPLSLWKTWWAAMYVKRVARLMWIPVGRAPPLKVIRKFASRFPSRKENVIPVGTFSQLSSWALSNSFVNAVCGEWER